MIITREHAVELAETVFQQEIDALNSIRTRLDRDTFCTCADLIAARTGLVWVTGVGTSAAVGRRFAHLLTCCGVRSIFLSPEEGLHGHSAVLMPDDLLIAMSRGGESAEVNQMVSIAERRGATTIAFVGEPDSTLGKACKLRLAIRSQQEYELKGCLATTSTVVFSAVCDAICSVVAEATGFSLDHFGETHPGGAVGLRLNRESS